MIPRRHIPNALTLARYFAVLGLIGVWFLPEIFGTWTPFSLFVFAAITDFFDGYLARKWQVVSDLGRLLDPNADKLLVAAALILLVQDGRASAVAVSLILCRELWVSGLREFMAERRIVVHVSTLAKWKTTTQMIACIALLAAHADLHPLAFSLGCALLWTATALTLITGAQYTCGALKHIRS